MLSDLHPQGLEQFGWGLGDTRLVAEGSAGGDATTSCRSAGWESSAGAA